MSQGEETSATHDMDEIWGQNKRRPLPADSELRFYISQKMTEINVKEMTIGWDTNVVIVTVANTEYIGRNTITCVYQTRKKVDMRPAQLSMKLRFAFSIELWDALHSDLSQSKMGSSEKAENDPPAAFWILATVLAAGTISMIPPLLRDISNREVPWASDFDVATHP